MFLLREFIQSILLTEGRLEDVKKKYPDVDVDYLAEHDPSGNYAYLAWMVKQSVPKHDSDPTESRQDNDDDIIWAIEKFHEYKQNLAKRDINSYKTLSELEQVVEERSRRGATKVAENKKYVLLHIKNKDMCISLGKATNWCITMKNRGYWENYADDQNAIIFYAVPTEDILGTIPKRINPETANFEAENNQPEQYIQRLAVVATRNIMNEVDDMTFWLEKDEEVDVDYARRIIGSDLIEKAKNFAESIEKIPFVFKVMHGELSVSELDAYLDTLSEEEQKEIVKKIKWLREFWKFLDSKHSIVRMKALGFFNADDLENFAQQLAKDPDHTVRMSAVIRMQYTRKLNFFAGDPNKEIFRQCFFGTLDKVEFCQKAIELNNLNFVQDAILSMPHDSINAKLLKFALRNFTGTAMSKVAKLVMQRLIHPTTGERQTFSPEDEVLAVENLHTDELLFQFVKLQHVSPEAKAVAERRIKTGR